MRNITLPEWTHHMPDDAQVTSKEILVIFGYSPKTGIYGLVKDGLLPKADSKHIGFTRVPGRNASKLFWSMKTLRDLVESQTP